MRLLQLVLAGVTCWSLGSVSHAAGVSFDHVGDSATVNFDVANNSTLHAQFTYTLFRVVGDRAIFDIDVLNNSTGTGVNRLNSFGIVTVAPDLVSVTDNSNAWDVSVNSLITTNPDQQVDFCARFTTSNAAAACGDGSNGIAEGGSRSLRVTMTFANTLDLLRQPITFTDFAVRFVVDRLGTQDLVSLAATDVVFTNFVPEPESAALVALGLLALGARRKLKAAKAA